MYHKITIVVNILLIIIIIVSLLTLISALVVMIILDLWVSRAALRIFSNNRVLKFCLRNKIVLKGGIFKIFRIIVAFLIIFFTVINSRVLINFSNNINLLIISRMIFIFRIIFKIYANNSHSSSSR
jgi:hypothetical protein